MTPSTVKSLPGSRSHNQWLVLIALFKFAQALLFVAIGIGAHRLLKKNLADELQTLADHLRFNPESHVVNFILVKASLVDAHMLRRIGLVAFCYAALGSAEGIGLYLEKAWGEYLTLVITASFLPWEIFEIFRRVTWIRVSLLTINLVVFLYLIKIVFERGRPGFRRRKS
jgi:uncharacterized membrane protein (DUF2068 family)